jgi:hypothetical protein
MTRAKAVKNDRQASLKEPRRWLWNNQIWAIRPLQAINLFGFRNKKKFTVYEHLSARVYFSLPLWGGQIRKKVWACRRNFHDNWLSPAACF